MAERDLTHDDALPPGEQAKLRFYFVSGSLIGGLGVLALAADEFGTGVASLAIGLASLVLGVKRGQAVTAAMAALAGQTQAQTQSKSKNKTQAQSKSQSKGKGKNGSGAEASPFTVWYTVCVGLVLMGGGAATTVFARHAETRTAEIFLFLAAGVLLWMGATCIIAARLKARRGGAPAPKRRGRGRQRA